VNCPPRVSVVIPCFNHGDFLREAVASVAASTERDDVEIIVVDDGSTDERTRTETDRLIAQGTTVIRQENRGLAAARNAGIAASKSEYIFPLDADDRVRAGFTAPGIHILDANPKIGVVYGDMEFFGARTGRWISGRFDPNQLMRQNYFACSAFFRRSVWEQNGGYDGTMPVQGFEDWDFWLGALEHGWEFAYVPEVLFDYRKAQESMLTRTVGFEEQVARFVALKHGPLYRQAWMELANEHDSGKATFRNLRRIVKSRLKQKLRIDGDHG